HPFSASGEINASITRDSTRRLSNKNSDALLYHEGIMEVITCAVKLDTEYRLDDNLTADSGRAFLTGTQALVRMLLSQRRADERNGLNAAGFVTGYRGSPLPGVDTAMWRAKGALENHQISFLPSINEDLGATIVMGPQQAGVRA